MNIISGKSTAALALGTLALAGCGGGSSTSTTPSAKFADQAVIVQKGDTICAAATTKRNAVKAPAFDINKASGGQLAAAAAYLSQVLPIETTKVLQLRALGTPKSQAQEFAQAIANEESLTGALTGARQYATAHQARAYAGIMSIAQKLRANASAAEKQFGFKVCGTVSHV